MRLPLLALALCVTAAPAAARNTKDWATASDFGAYGLAAFSLANPLVVGDRPGFWQAAGSDVGAYAVSYGLKSAIKEQRPDHSGNDSFPSNHAAVAFASAATLWRRDGWRVGFPAEAVAIFTGVARVQARAHHWYDVVAGAGIGTASGFLITKPLNSGAQLMPWADSHGGGVMFQKRF